MSKSILIIEDNAHDSKTMLKFLNGAGFEDIIVEKTGEDGVAKARSEKPDLIIIDTILPGINGFEVCRQIKQFESSTNPKIIIMTGNVDAIDASRARSEGADDYVVKTSDCAHLIKAVKKLI